MDADGAGVIERTGHAEAVGIAAGQQSGPRCGADGLRDIEAGEARAFCARRSIFGVLISFAP